MCCKYICLKYPVIDLHMMTLAHIIQKTQNVSGCLLPLLIEVLQHQGTTKSLPCCLLSIQKSNLKMLKRLKKEDQLLVQMHALLCGYLCKTAALLNQDTPPQ